MPGWSLERAEEHLRSLELFGMRFGLERMRRLLAELGSPQRAFPAVHVVGTNGKSSTVRMTAAILEAHGRRTGAYLSPHLSSWAERIRVGDADLPGDAFAAAVEEAAAAAARVDRGLSDGDRVTQFELLTAAALAELARRRVDVAVVEAGLGGRHDATNVLAARVVALTSVSLEHTAWLGSTVAEIAREKLAVVARGATLVLGRLDAEAAAEARAAAARQGARLVWAPEVAAPGLDGYQRANFAVARSAARAHLGRLDEALTLEAARSVRTPGRLQLVGEAPLTILDGAHNPAGVAALVEALGDVAGDRPLVAVVGVLDDKDAEGMLRPLLPRCTRAVLTASESPRALPAETLAAVAGRVAATPVEVVTPAARALARARELAGPDGAVVATGSITLVADLVGLEAELRTPAP